MVLAAGHVLPLRLVLRLNFYMENEDVDKV